MNKTEIKTMRRKQLIVSNVLFVTLFVLYFLIINLIQMKISTHFFICAILMLVLSISNLLRGYSTKSFIPIFEQVAIYEKNKMGKEWIKQKKSIWIGNFILSALLFLQYFLHHNSSTIFEMDILFFSGFLLLLILGINTTMLLQFSKVDSKTSESDFKGYNWKWHVISLGIGIILAILFFMVIFIYIFLKI